MFSPELGEPVTYEVGDLSGSWWRTITTTNRRSPGGRFVLHDNALPGNPYAGHTLAEAIEEPQMLIGCAIERA